MSRGRFPSCLALAALLSGCGGGDSGGESLVTAPVASGTTPAASATTAVSCSLRDRQDWAAAQLRDWYLFPDTLPATLDPTPYGTLGDYIDALTATARAQRKDRFFTYATSIAAENAFYDAGTSAGFGIRLSTDASGRLFVSEAFEGTPALAAGIDRGTEIVAIGSTAADLRTVAAIYAAEGSAGVNNALGPSTAGTTRLLRIADAGGTRDVSVAKAEYTLTPVSSRYGARIIDDGGRRFGYLNLRTFIDPAETPLRSAFASFRAAGVTDVVVDLRYNGGGLVSVSQLLGDLLGGGRASSEVFDRATFRPEKASNNTVHTFQRQPQSIAPTRIAFIGTGGTASASEIVINGFVPYLHANAALIGANTFGKPVGQIALDRAACDDRLRVIAFAEQNAAGVGDYYDGLATKVEASCRAADDLSRPLGDPQEASTRAALDFLEGKGCVPLTASAFGGARIAPAELLTPERPTTAQREVPGSF